MKYATIVADPPWPLKAMPAWKPYVGGGRAARRRTEGETNTGTDPMPYRTAGIQWIKDLPVASLAEPNAHLYLWTINAFVEDAYHVARAWGFEPSRLLTWSKPPMGMGPGGAFVSTTEFFLFCRRGTLATKQRADRSCFNWPRVHDSRGPVHSAKPDAFLDLVEAMSPGPYVELFARRARFGWDYWGDQSLGTADMAA